MTRKGKKALAAAKPSATATCVTPASEAKTTQGSAAQQVADAPKKETRRDRQRARRAAEKEAASPATTSMEDDATRKEGLGRILVDLWNPEPGSLERAFEEHERAAIEREHERVRLLQDNAALLRCLLADGADLDAVIAEHGTTHDDVVVLLKTLGFFGDEELSEPEPEFIVVDGELVFNPAFDGGYESNETETDGLCESCSFADEVAPVEATKSTTSDAAPVITSFCGFHSESSVVPQSAVME